MGPKRKYEGEEDINDFNQKSWKEDLALIVDGKRLYVSRAVLALESPVFCAMFEADFAEKNEAEIELKEKTYKDILEFLQCLYPGVRKPVTVENVFTVLALAEEYQVGTVKGECEKCLLQELSSPLKSTDFYCHTQRVSSLFNLPEVEEACIELLSKRTIIELENSEKSYPLPLDSKNKLLTKMNKKQDEKIKEIENDHKRKMSAKDKQYHAAIVGLRQKEKILEMFESFYGHENDHRIQGTITLDFDNASELSTEGKSADKKFRGYTWRLTVRKNVVDGNEYLSVWATFIGGLRAVQCTARIMFTLKGRSRNKEAVIAEKKFLSSQSWGYPSWLRWEEFIFPTRGFIQNNKATVEMFAMVHHPVQES